MTLSSQDYAALSADAYNTHEKADEPIEIGGKQYRVLKQVSDGGYQGTIYQNVDSGEIVVAHRGSEFQDAGVQAGALDALTDGNMAINRTNEHAKAAIELTREALRMAEQQGESNPPKPEVTVTGHSLGGSLAQISAHYFDLGGETFNAYGAVSLAGHRIPEQGRLINHVMAGDTVSAGSKHYGEVRVYTTPQELDVLRGAGYPKGSSKEESGDPFQVAGSLLLGSHSMKNFLDAGPGEPPRESVLGDPAAAKLAADNGQMIGEYRQDVQGHREALTQILGNRLTNLQYLFEQYYQGPIPPGDPGRRDQLLPGGGPFTYYRAAVTRDDAPAPTAHAQDGSQANAQADVGSLLERITAASRNGDRDGFRQLTQEAAAAEPGRALQHDAVATVDRQEREALVQSQAQAESQQASARGPRMG